MPEDDTGIATCATACEFTTVWSNAAGLTPYGLDRPATSSEAVPRRGWISWTLEMAETLISTGLLEIIFN